MNLQKYMVEGGNKQHFIAKFKELMDVDVSSIVVIDTLMSHVEPAGNLPVGFVLMENGQWFLVGWTDRKKRCHPQNLYPHKKKELALYAPWTEKSYTYRELYKCVFQRMRQLDDFPTVVSNVYNWEYNRQALFSCGKLLENPILSKIVTKEIELLTYVMKDNRHLLKNTCTTLGLEVDVHVLIEHVKRMYDKDMQLDLTSFANSGILNLVKEHALSKWNI